MLDDNDDFFADLAAQQGEADVVVVLVTVADDEAAGPFVHGEGDHQLGFRPGLEAVAEVLAGGDDFIDDLAELVDLDGEHPAVFAFVTLFLDGLAEKLVELGDAVAQEILETDDHRGLQAHASGLVNHIHDTDAAAVGEGLDVDETAVVHSEVAGTPAFKAIKFFGLGG